MTTETTAVKWIRECLPLFFFFHSENPCKVQDRHHAQRIHIFSGAQSHMIFSIEDKTSTKKEKKEETKCTHGNSCACRSIEYEIIMYTCMAGLNFWRVLCVHVRILYFICIFYINQFKCVWWWEFGSNFKKVLRAGWLAGLQVHAYRFILSVTGHGPLCIVV